MTRRSYDKIVQLVVQFLGLKLLRYFKVRSAQAKCLLSLILSTREHGNVRAQLRRELDGQVSESTDPDDTNAVARLDAVSDHWCEYSQTGTEERCCLSAGNVVGNLVKVGVWPDRVCGEGALVAIR